LLLPVLVLLYVPFLFSLTMLTPRADLLPLEGNPTYTTSLLDGTTPTMIDEYQKKTMVLDM
jgi:hypothetical protein